MSLRAKLLLFLFPSLLLLFIGLYYAVSVAVDHEERLSVATFAEKHLQVINDLQQERFEHLATKSEHVASLPIFKAALAERSVGHIKTVTDNLLKLPDSPLMIISDAQGQTLMQSTQLTGQNDKVKAFPSIVCALKGKECRNVSRIGDKVYNMVSKPVSSGPNIWGVLTTGFIYSDLFLESLKEATEYCDITVTDNNGSINASTLPPEHFAAIEAQIRSHDLAGMQILQKDLTPHILDLKGEKFLSLSRVVVNERGQPIAHLIVHQSLQGLEAILANVQQRFILMGSVILLFLLLGDLLIARGLVKPIEQLEKAAGEIGVDDRRLNMEMPASKEARLLAQAINGMLLELYRKTGELRNSETQYRNMINSAHDAIISADADMNILVWNKQAESLFGYGESEILGQHVNTIIPSQHHALHHHMNNTQPDGAMMQSMTRRMLGTHKNGNEIPIEINLSKSTDNDNNPVFTTIIRDLSNQVEAESQQRMLTNAIEQSSDMIVITDIDATILYVNPAFERTTGYKLNEVIGKSTKLLKSGEQSPAFYAEMWETIQAGKVWNGRVINRRKNGQLYPEEMVISPVRDESGVTRQYVAIKRDVGEQEKLKIQIEHTQRLESLGVLAGGIAHDFNNILTAIMGNAAMAESKMDVQSPAIDHVESIVHASHRAADLCKQMLAYSGKGQFIVKPIDLSELVEQMSKLLEVSISKNILLNYNLNENLPAINADVSQMQQIIMNLITNASEAIGKEKKGTISITTKTFQADETYLNDTLLGAKIEPGDYVYLEVSDNGCGMNEATLKKIFDPFFTTKFSGRGLGMSAVLGIVRGHKGSMKLSSEPGIGTSFKILFPCVDIAAETLNNLETPSDEWQASGTILVVDDEETILEVATAMLSDMGFSTLTAIDGIEGVEMYKRHADEITGVLLDMTMPRMNGEEAFSEILKCDPNAKVILSSGYNEQEATNRFAGKGLVGFIQKPYTPDMLASKLREALNL
ncbi:blue-light-activated protein [Mariprofundus micogutta]|uniref:histidine kinase n=1 Tax=Mariprofundus micogutta TaxID=1921010 RepID=A0A1L8CLB7_9PROT|nr:PAS domain S-box protein [Mariprofundus micogutta]GAV19685.1 blue-light-activated protein [Mariprofundus micogutta]